MKIRMKFKKQGALRFIGHLDILRYFQKVMRRADVDICYSEGFSPHQIMSFAAPLGVGLLSNGEYVDIEVNTTKDSKTMIEQINRANAEGFEVTSYRQLEDSAKNAMSMVAAADYKVWFKEGYEPDNSKALFEKFKEFTQLEKIEIIKKTKKGEKSLDLKHYIYEVSINEKVIFMKLASGSSANIKPELVLTAFYETMGKEYPVFDFQVEREEVYADEGTEISHRFISLEEYGVDIE
ncbi:MAG: TIGR03936 family radical SAM-associated protein [Clostridium sp.]